MIALLNKLIHRHMDFVAQAPDTPLVSDGTKVFWYRQLIVLVLLAKIAIVYAALRYLFTGQL